MFRTLFLLIVCSAPSFGVSFAFEPGELVVAARSLALRERSNVNDEVAAGQVRRVLAVAESRLGQPRQAGMGRADTGAAAVNAAIGDFSRAYKYQQQAEKIV